MKKLVAIFNIYCQEKFLKLFCVNKNIFLFIKNREHKNMLSYRKLQLEKI